MRAFNKDDTRSISTCLSELRKSLPQQPVHQTNMNALKQYIQDYIDSFDDKTAVPSSSGTVQEQQRHQAEYMIADTIKTIRMTVNQIPAKMFTKEQKECCYDKIYQLAVGLGNIGIVLDQSMQFTKKSIIPDDTGGELKTSVPSRGFFSSQQIRKAQNRIEDHSRRDK